MEENREKSYYVENIKFDRKALTEVYEMLMEYEDGIENVPENILKVIEDNRDKEYVFDINEIENIELMEETKRILTYIYTEFLSTGEEHEVLKQMEKMQYEKRKELELTSIQESKNSDEIFSSRKEENDETLEIKELPVEYKESVIKKIINKIINKIKGIFN